MRKNDDTVPSVGNTLSLARRSSYRRKGGRFSFGTDGIYVAKRRTAVMAYDNEQRYVGTGNKEAQKPIIEAQKAKAKEFRKKAQDFKMSKMKPTKKQLYYYEKVAKAHGITMKETSNASRLDLRNWIMDIIEPKELEDNDD